MRRCFARPGEGHDKGSVESRGKGIRLAHMSPVPQGRTLEEIARGVLASVDAAHGNRARWQEEQAALREQPLTAFEARKLRIVRVSRQATVQLGGATYSVPSRWKSLQVHARVGTGDIVFTCRGAEYRCDLVRPGQRLPPRSAVTPTAFWFGWRPEDGGCRAVVYSEEELAVAADQRIEVR